MTSEATETKAKAYQRRQLSFGLIEEIGTLVFLMACVWLVPRVVGHFSDLGRYPLLIVTAVLMYLSYQVIFFGLDYWSGYRLEHQFDLSTEDFAQWLWRHVKAIGLAGLLLGGLVVLLYTGVWYVKYWYVWCWAGWMLLAILLAQVFPVLILPIFYRSTRLENAVLLERFRSLAHGTGLTVEGVYSLALSESTKKANAMLAGLGRTRRVLLGDTLLGRMTDEQLEVVYAHELGHHVYRHFFKTLVLHALASVLLFALIYLVLNPYSGSDPNAVAMAVARLPLMALVLSLFTFGGRPVFNAVSRHFETQCDRYALARTKAPEQFVAAFEALAEQNLADPSPPRWVVWLYYDHPPIHERIALAKVERTSRSNK